MRFSVDNIATAREQARQNVRTAYDWAANLQRQSAATTLVISSNIDGADLRRRRQQYPLHVRGNGRDDSNAVNEAIDRIIGKKAPKQRYTPEQWWKWILRKFTGMEYAYAAGVVLLTDGGFSTSNPINIDTGVILRGSGLNITTLTLGASTDGDVITSRTPIGGSRVSDIAITDMTIDQQGEEQGKSSGSSIRLKLVSNVLLERLRVRHGFEMNVQVVGDTPGDNNDVIIRDCLLEDSETNTSLGVGGIDRVLIEHNRCLAVDNAKCAGTIGIGPDECQDVWVSHCYVEKTDTDGIRAEGTSRAPTRTWITDNTVLLADNLGIIAAESPVDMILRGNIVQNPATANAGGASNQGIRFVDGTRVHVHSNTVIDDRGGSAVMTFGIVEASSGTDNQIHDNVISGNQSDAISSVSAKVYHNPGFTTENEGTDTIASGTTSKAVTHNLDVTPSAEQIIVTPTNDPTNAPGHIWVDTIGSSQFTVNCKNDPGSGGMTFGWKVRTGD